MKKFKKVYIEITNVCNLSCDFCPKTNRKAAFMDKVVFERIIEKLKGHANYLYFHVMGEPLLHPDLGTFLDVSGNYGFKVNITTNGTLIEKTAGLLISKQALRQVNFSLHSFEANEKTSELDKYLDNIFNFIEKSQIGREIAICLRLWNLCEEGNSQLNSHVLKRIEDEFKLDFRIEEKLTPCNGIRLAQNIFLNQASRFEWPDIQIENKSSRGFCYGLRDQIGVLVDGTVIPCCLDKDGAIELGNLLDMKLEDILNSGRAKNIYEGFSKREAVELLCQKCGYRERFGN